MNWFFKQSKLNVKLPQ